MARGYGGDDPIAAIATPPGESALAVIRTTGAGTLDLLGKVFSRPARLLAAPGNTVVHGWIVAESCTESGGGPSRIDEVLVSVFRPPASYTGEESAEVSCHGGASAQRGVMTALRNAGFRDALPGEFTFRAFMNGKLDLTRAESVMEIVSAKTDRGREHAVGRLSGVLAKEIRDLQSALVEILAGVEIFLDYSEDEIDGDGGPFPGREAALGVLSRLRAMSAAWKRERLYQEGALLVIAGPPNAGKSSLFNLLLAEERSIVTEIPGTTRDWIEAWVSLGGIPVRLADTAGLRDSPAEGPALDPVERIGVARSRELLSRADLVLYLVDGTEGFTAGDIDFFAEARGGVPALAVWNKCDLAGTSPVGVPPELCPVLEISAKTGAGVEALCEKAAKTLERAAGGEGDAAAPGTRRQKELIDAASASLEEALNLASLGEPLELIAPPLREAINALGEITGEISTADILEIMFSRFCVGK